MSGGVYLARLAVILAGALIAFGIWWACGWLWRRWRQYRFHRR